MAVLRCEKCGPPQGKRLSYASSRKLASDTSSRIFCAMAKCTRLALVCWLTDAEETGVRSRGAAFQSSGSWKRGGDMIVLIASDSPQGKNDAGLACNTIHRLGAARSQTVAKTTRPQKAAWSRSRIRQEKRRADYKSSQETTVDRDHDRSRGHDRDIQ